jgi:hypothetical protein
MGEKGLDTLFVGVPQNGLPLRLKIESLPGAGGLSTLPGKIAAITPSGFKPWE